MLEWADYAACFSSPVEGARGVAKGCGCCGEGVRDVRGGVEVVEWNAHWFGLVVWGGFAIDSLVGWGFRD